jgi:large subunit ribosomal protein L7/L12
MSATTDEIIQSLKGITLFEATELVAQIETTFGVDATLTSSGGATAPLEGGTAPAEAAEEKTQFDVILEDIASDKRVASLKVIRNLTALGLKEAKDFTSSLPKAVKEGVSKEEAETAKQQLEEVGGTVRIN